jgi:cysteinyl-tRNA synthetase
MAQKYLGDCFDIHCGGEDHIPVHHTNEIAQTEARSGTRLANFWLHGYFLLENDAKMAKSAGEFLRLTSLIERGYDPLAYRYLCLTAHYRSQLNFTWDALDGAATALDRMRRGFHGLPAGGAPDASCLERFTTEINNDLNVPRALALAWELLRGGLLGAGLLGGGLLGSGPLRGELAPEVRKATLAAFDRVFGLGLAAWLPKEETIPEAVLALAAARAAARDAKQWAEADRLRAELNAAGWEVEDRPDGYALKRR